MLLKKCMNEMLYYNVAGDEVHVYVIKSSVMG